MAQLTRIGLVKLMGLVTLIMVIPMVGGAVAGVVIDDMVGTSPLLVLGGLALGTLTAAMGIWLLIRSGLRNGYGRGPGDGA